MTIAELRERLENGTLPTVPSSTTTSNFLANHNLDNYTCEKCGDIGYTTSIDENGEMVYHTCECLERRKALRRLRNSGLEAQAQKCTFESFIADSERASNLLGKAKNYLEEPKGKWFFVSGVPGSGKTHICTAIAVSLIDMGNGLRYMRWRQDAGKLKRAIGSDPDYYDSEIESLQESGVLYIDDFLKGSVTDADLNLAFEILDYRYLQPDSRTIISTELSMPELREIDDAIARRIFERAKGYCCASPDRNYSFTR